MKKKILCMLLALFFVTFTTYGQVVDNQITSELETPSTNYAKDYVGVYMTEISNVMFVKTEQNQQEDSEARMLVDNVICKIIETSENNIQLEILCKEWGTVTINGFCNQFGLYLDDYTFKYSENSDVGEIFYDFKLCGTKLNKANNSWSSAIMSHDFRVKTNGSTKSLSYTDHVMITGFITFSLVNKLM